MRVVETGEIPAGAPRRPRSRQPAYVSAFYLPQFHPTRENDAWWGKGFTEWTAVTRARPNFAGHVQPFLPADLGFYDLRVPETMGEQWRLAERGRHRRLLRLPLLVRTAGGRPCSRSRSTASSPGPDVPFRYYLCWANEAWRRNWDGLSARSCSTRATARASRPASSPRPCPTSPTRATPGPTGGGRASSIYRPTDLPDPAGSVARMRAAWAAAGHAEVELGAVLFHVEGESPVAPELFDFWVEMPPHGLVGPKDYLVGGPNGDAARARRRPRLRAG